MPDPIVLFHSDHDCLFSVIVLCWTSTFFFTYLYPLWLNSYFLFRTGSWRSGLGFNALIHAHRPDLIDFSQLQPTRHIDNLNNAFDVASTELGIPRLLDAEGKNFTY